jgi:Xaa-Pro aminopeptidase
MSALSDRAPRSGPSFEPLAGETARTQRLAELLRERELDMLLVGGPVNLRYITGFTGSNGLALVGAAGDHGVSGAARHQFFTDFRYATQSAEQLPGVYERRIVQVELIEAAARALAGKPDEAGAGRDPAEAELAAEAEPVAEAELAGEAELGLEADGSATRVRLGFDEAALTVKQHLCLRELLPAAYELIPAAGLVEGLREIKDAAELQRIRAAALLADEALRGLLEGGVAGRTEREVAIELELRMRRLGATAPSFASIVAAGPHSALPHAEARDVEIPRDTLVTIDWGAELDGYCSDCTRTFATGEAVPQEDREVYELVLHAQLAGLAAVRPGPSGREVDAVAREVIERAGHGEHFGHGLGHGVGLEVHEAPRLSRTAPDQPLRAGHVVTVEPGVYIPGRIGVRIEDLLAVTADGHELLGGGLPKELTVVG